MVGDMSHVTLNFDLSKIPFVHFILRCSAKTAYWSYLTFSLVSSLSYLHVVVPLLLFTYSLNVRFTLL